MMTMNILWMTFNSYFRCIAVIYLIVGPEYLVPRCLMVCYVHLQHYTPMLVMLKT